MLHSGNTSPSTLFLVQNGSATARAANNKAMIPSSINNPIPTMTPTFPDPILYFSGPKSANSTYAMRTV